MDKIRDLATLLVPWLRTVPRVCEYSARHRLDLHDYYRCAGGDGTPSHFHAYKCWNCEKEFGI